AQRLSTIIVRRSAPHPPMRGRKGEGFGVQKSPPQQANKTKLLHTHIADLCIVHLIQIYQKLTIPADRPAFGNGLSEEGPEYARAFGFSDQHEGRRGQIHDDGFAR
ncbi:hypothetical protein, partial [Vitreimonas sp.]|uniref:hypothetical protein n=1 Tax=Vitreimonas sp. TaxID=3069702 RepID=UPI002EDA8606